MALSDGFQGRIVTATLTAGGGSVLIQGILRFKPPSRQYKKATYTPMSGSLAKKEQVLLTSEQAATIELTVLYEPAHKAAMDAAVGAAQGAVVLTLSDGSTYTGTGSVERHGETDIDDSKEVQADLVIALNAGWVFAAGS